MNDRIINLTHDYRDWLHVGYKLHEVYPLEITYGISEPTQQKFNVLELEPRERHVDYHWHWIPTGGRDFTVVLTYYVLPSLDYHERITLNIAGKFSIEDDQPMWQIPFREFVSEPALTLIFPYAKEIVSSLTSHGPYEPYFLPPLDPSRLRAQSELGNERAIKMLQADPELGIALFGLKTLQNDPEWTAMLFGTALPADIDDPKVAIGIFTFQMLKNDPKLAALYLTEQSLREPELAELVALTLDMPPINPELAESLRRALDTIRTRDTVGSEPKERPRRRRKTKAGNHP